MLYRLVSGPVWYGPGPGPGPGLGLLSEKCSIPVYAFCQHIGLRPPPRPIIANDNTN